MKTELSTLAFILKLEELDIIVKDEETAIDMDYDMVYEQNHINFDLYINHNAFDDTNLECLSPIRRILNDGYSWYVQFYNEDTDEDVFTEFNIEEITIKATVKTIESLEQWLNTGII